MVLDERSRHELYLRLEEALGADAATPLMEPLPPIGWADVAMKRDLDALEQRLDLRFDLRFDAIDQRFDAVDQRFEKRLGSISTSGSERSSSVSTCAPKPWNTSSWRPSGASCKRPSPPRAASWPSHWQERPAPCRRWPSPPPG